MINCEFRLPCLIIETVELYKLSQCCLYVCILAGTEERCQESMHCDDDNEYNNYCVM